MSMSLLAVACFAAVQVDVAPLDHHPDTSYCIAADIGGRGQIDIVVMADQALYRYGFGESAEPEVYPLGDGVSAVDLFDLNGDGRLEALWIRGQEVVQRALETDAEEKVLFTLPAAPLPAGPFPQVLVRSGGEDLLVVVPSSEAIREYLLDGTLAAEYVVGENLDHHAALGRPLLAWTPLEPVVGPPGALEIHLTRSFALKPALPDWDGAMDESLMPGRHGTPQQMREVRSRPPAFWPWYPLTGPAEAESRVLYALEEGGDTVVRIRSRAGIGDDPGPVEVGPERRYPGAVVPPDRHAPDFNGDGYADLLTWRAPTPAPTVDALARAAARGTWPAYLALHLFEPANNRHSPRPVARLEAALPIDWFLSGLPPFHLLSTADLTGDGASDLAFALSPESLGLWRFKDGDFTPLTAPLTFPESLTGHLLTVAPAADHGAKLVYQSDTRYWVVRVGTH